MEGQKKRAQRDYTLAFKLAVVEQVEKGELAHKEARQRYGIQGRSMVLVWLRKHGRQDWSVSAEVKTTMENQSNQRKSFAPKQCIKELKVQLREVQEKVRLLETVIDVIQKECGARVVKKPSGRSLRRGSSKGRVWIGLAATLASAARRTANASKTRHGRARVRPRSTR